MSMVTRKLSFILLLLCFFTPAVLMAQGVTTAGMRGLITNEQGENLTGATVIAVHVPSGTTYGTVSLQDGRFFIPGMRVGGPYKVTVSFIGIETQTKENIFLSLGVTSDLNFTMSTKSVETSLVTVTGKRDAVFSSERTGAATSIDLGTIQSLPTISRRIGDLVRLTPQASGNQAAGLSFAGQDNRMNNISVDGSYFNNSFGLGGQPGDRTGVSPISLDAIEQVQVNVAPYDVRQGNFVGAGVNTVTKSGTNNFSGSAYYNFQHQGLVGTKAGALTYNPGTFKYNLLGVTIGGPVIKNKLFFFMNFETDGKTEPGTTYLANPGGAAVGGNMTRVLASDLDKLSTYLKTNFNYETGPYAGYDNKTPSLRFIGKVDFNLDDRNKITLRYNHLNSETDVLLSNSSSLGNGNRRSSTSALNFQNSNYSILENIRSIIGEWNSRLSDNMSNNLIVGYTYQDESRGYKGSMFPFVDILSGGTTYTSFGFEPFTPNNELRYKSFQFQDNFTYFLPSHTITLGVSAEKYESENVFFSGSQGVYIYNSLDDFYKDANAYLTNTPSTVTPKRFQQRWANIPGQEKPVQPLKVFYSGVYGQDEWQLSKDFKMTLGLRLDMPIFSETGFVNTNANGLTFMDENGNPVQYKTEKLPDANILFSPRIGFNWDLFGDRTTQLRGGTGVFTGRPAYVWISNQIGNNGVITGFEDVQDAATLKNRHFNPNPDAYKKAATGLPASSYELALTDPNFRFPQVWRSNFAIDQKLPFDLIATAEFIYNKDVNAVYYINANLPKTAGTYSGVDKRVYWNTASNANRINSNVQNAIVLKNGNDGNSYNLSFTLEKPFTDGVFGKIGYNYSESKSVVDPGSVAYGSWSGNAQYGNPNNPAIGFSTYNAGGRLFAALSYHLEYFDFGGTTLSAFFESSRAGNSAYPGAATSYIFANDANGDGATNDLIYIPNNTSEMNFEQYIASGKTFTVDAQKAAFEAYINQDDYLKEHRGQYAERNAVVLPRVNRVDLSLTQDLFTELFGVRNSLQFRVDVINFTNLLNKEWGQGSTFVQPRILTNASKDANGALRYRFNNISGNLIDHTYDKTNSIFDVYRIQFGIRYNFN